MKTIAKLRKIIVTIIIITITTNICLAKAKIGLVVAVEMESVLSKYGKPKQKEIKSGFEVITYKNSNYTMYAINSGCGEINAAAATQVLIDKYNVDIVINFGVSGGLTAEMSLTNICIVDKIIHYDFDLSELDPVVKGQYPGQKDCFLYPDTLLINKAIAIYPELRKVTCASADKFVSKPEKKLELNKEFGAEICEMESAAILLTCLRNKIPCLIIKTISDSLTGGGKEFYTELKKSSDLCISITDKLINELFSRK